MPAVTRPRGPLPARVYWRRRLAVLGVATMLVVGLARVLDVGGDGASDSPGPLAQLVGEASEPEAAPTDEATAARADEEIRTRKNKRQRRQEQRASAVEPTQVVLAAPSGPCADGDVLVTPVVADAAAGGRVEITLEVTSREAEACTWVASRDTMTVSIRSGTDPIWNTRHCPGGLDRPQEVTARRSTPGLVTMSWSGRRSDAACSNLTAWALPGFYHVEAAAFSGEPSSVQFELGRTPRPVVTRTVQPKPKAREGRDRQRQRTRGDRPGDTPTHEPLDDGQSGAVEPDG